jgi:hypothetical protein
MRTAVSILVVVVLLPAGVQAREGRPGGAGIGARFKRFWTVGAQRRQVKRQLNQNLRGLVKTAKAEKRQNGRASFATLRKLAGMRKARKLIRDGNFEVGMQRWAAPVIKVGAAVGAGLVFENPWVGVGTWLLFNHAQKKAGLLAVGQRMRSEGVARAAKLGVRVGDELRRHSMGVLSRESKTHVDRAASLQNDAVQHQRQAARLRQLGAGL